MFSFLSELTNGIEQNIEKKENNMRIKIKEIATELGVTSKDILLVCKKLGIVAKNSNTSISLESASRIVQYVNKYNMKKTTSSQQSQTKNSPLSPELSKILSVDKIRANIVEYDEKILKDVNKGSWEVFAILNGDNPNYNKDSLDKSFIAKNPQDSIVEGGVIGIDFGTKSTVVVYQEGNEKILPIRVGIGDWNKQEQAHHYENPTIMEFISLNQFLDDYNKVDFRPYTKWDNLTISHTAFNNLHNSSSEKFNAYLTELKQWAGDKNRKLKIQDYDGKIFELKKFLEVKKEDLNPIEIYAYYLGLYINNQHKDSIFLEYLLSFPVTYEKDVRENILKSFTKGLKKALPNIGEKIKDLKVTAGVSEPAAYAAVALEEYNLAEENEKNFYAIFDFGGGTTDFDFGIFRWADETNRKERRYDYVIEHFGAGGEKYLGGENLLELLAFEVFKDNKDILREKNISFILPPECDDFLGSELLISDSREAKINMVNLVNELRKFWERESFDDEIFKGEIKVDLFPNRGKKISKVPLKVDEKKLYEILKTKIQKGIEAFFVGLMKSFDSYQNEIEFDIDKINIFLAGNSSKSPIVKEIFDEKIEKFQEDFEKENINAEIKIFAPLDNKDDFTKPNGKTGVAFGLIKTRPGGRILVIDKNKMGDNVRFNYYLGMNRRGKFKTIIDRDTPYNEWKVFIDAGDDVFEVYYTSSALANQNNLSINDNSVKKLRLHINKVDEELDVFIRIISPTAFEYGVGSCVDDIEDIQKVELS